MKSTGVFFTALCISLFSCNIKPNTNHASADTTKKITYPFTPRYSINWKPGDEKNALIVLNCLKKYLANDMKGAVENFADTVEFIADQFYFKGKKDSLATILGEIRGSMVSIQNF